MFIAMGREMQEDFLDELKELALGSRLKRLSERMLANAGDIYHDFDMRIKPKWFTLLALLDQKGPVTVVEASSLLGLSQPALSQFCRELNDEGLITFNKVKVDARQRLLKLSPKGKAAITKMKPIWKAVEQSAIDLCEENNNDFYRSLVQLEKAFANKNLLLRTHEYMTESTMEKTQIKIIDFDESLAHHFESINQEWIDDMFVLEGIDKQVLQNPKGHIIDKGGKIWFAEHPLHGVIGTCALLNKGDGAFELTKMGVKPSVRGLKVGEKLLLHVIAQAMKMQVSLLFLLTNAKCEAAIHLYEKNGFLHDKNIMQNFGKSYERCNVAMKYEAR